MTPTRLQLTDERLKETLHSYDAHPDFYTRRYRAVDMSSYRQAFLSALPKPDGRVLDAGCGPGRDCAEFSSAGVSVVGLDLSPRLLAEARSYAPNTSFVNADIRAMPFHARTFDGVWMCSSLVHLPPESTAEVLREVRRVLRSDGVLFASVMEGTEAGWREDGLGGRRWFEPFTEDLFTALVKESGLALVSSRSESGVAMGRWVNVLARREG